MYAGLKILNNPTFLTLSYPSIAKLVMRQGLDLKIIKQGVINGEAIVVSKYYSSKQSLQNLLTKISNSKNEEFLTALSSEKHPTFKLLKNY